MLSKAVAPACAPAPRLLQRPWDGPAAVAPSVTGMRGLPPRSRRCSLHCRAAKDSAVAVRERSGISKLDEPPNSFVEDFLQPIFSPTTLVPLALGTGGAYALGLGTDGLALGAALGGALRLAQLLFLQQEVPFTERRHSLLLPVGIELQMGSAIFQKQLRELEARGKVLPESSREYKLINRIAERVINAVEQGRGGGFQGHISKFQWEVVAVEDKTPNAFVLPGGKIVVFTGLIALMEGDEDLLAAVIGHEVAHALARHSTEKLSLGLTITVVANLLIAFLNIYQRRQTEQQYQSRAGNGSMSGMRGGGGAGFRGIPASFPGMQAQQARGGFPGYGAQRNPYGLAGRARPGWGGGGYGRPGLLNPQLLSIFTNIFLQLPFSRRAEAEADLIGLKLMALAGYNSDKAPETFRRLANVDPARMKGMAGSDTARIVSSVQCTHPRSDKRVQMLEEELGFMRKHADLALDRVMHKIPYWML